MPTNRRGGMLAIAAGLALIAGACGSSTRSSAAVATPAATPAESTSAQVSATSSPAPGRPPHVMLIVEENNGYQNVIGNPKLPFINSLATRYALATHWSDLSHPSLPNYLGLTSGSIWNNPPDTTPHDRTYPGPSLVDQLAGRGIGWAAYMEDMPRPCDLGDEFGPADYDVNHDPFVYYDSVRLTESQCRQVVPYTSLSADLAGGTAPPFIWVTPNLIHDMHDGSYQQADAWLHALMDQVMASSWWAGGGVVVLTWDESESGEQVATIVISDHLDHVVFSRPGDHYGTLRAIEELYGLPLLGSAASADHGDLLPLLRPT